MSFSLVSVNFSLFLDISHIQNGKKMKQFHTNTHYTYIHTHYTQKSQNRNNNNKINQQKKNNKQTKLYLKKNMRLYFLLN